jgi:hypothetical protein
MTKAWKIIALTERMGSAAPLKEYFLVAIPDKLAALATLRLRRPDLQEATFDIVGAADQKFVNWLDVKDGEVFCVKAVS